MSHELSITNKVEMAYLQSDGTPWHNLGQPMADGSTLEEWAEATNFSNFVFKTAPVIWYDAATDDCYEYSSRKVVYRSDNRAPIGDVGVNFQVDQPMEILQFFDSVIRDFGYTMTSAGLLYGGKKIWAQANVPGEVLTLPGGDTVRGRLRRSAHLPYYDSGSLPEHPADGDASW
jgi:hypothetical protein